MQTGEMLLAWTVGGLAAAWILGQLRWRFAPGVMRGGNRILDSVEKRLPLGLLPIEHVLTCVVLAALTGVVTQFPQWGPWAVVADATGLTSLQPATLLAMAAALLALLLFAANQIRGVEKDNAAGERYLGENIDTYLARRSRALRVRPACVSHCGSPALRRSPHCADSPALRG